MPLLLLDTHVLIWLAEGRRLQDEPRMAIERAANAGTLIVSATSAWEVGLLETRTRTSGQLFGGNARRWFAKAVEALRLRVAAFDETIAFEAAYLPGDFPRDPSDRWIVATARIADATLITSDRAILAYSGAGHVRAMHA
jgi:PIN domain nuclease of toxin-antitoxin system